jgi:hypothetical protein
VTTPGKNSEAWRAPRRPSPSMKAKRSIVLAIALVATVFGLGCIAERIVYEQACKAGAPWRCYGVAYGE